MNRQSYIPRGIIIFLQIFGTFFALVGLLMYILYMGKVSDSIGGENSAGSKAIAAMILCFLTYLAWKTLYTAIVIVRFINNSSDDDISSNRYIISALSLNLGGFVTPFILTMLPNVATRSTINTRWFLSRTMGVTSLVGGFLGLLAFFLAVSTGINPLTINELFDTTQQSGIVGVSIIAISLATIVFGLITTIVFYQKSSQTIFNSGTIGFAKMMNAIAIVWLVVITIELFLTMIFAILRLLGALSDLFRAMNSDGFAKALFIIFAILNLVITAIYVGYVLHMTARTMTGIWSPDGVTYKPYESLARAEEKRAKLS